MTLVLDGSASAGLLLDHGSANAGLLKKNWTITLYGEMSLVPANLAVPKMRPSRIP